MFSSQKGNKMCPESDQVAEKNFPYSESNSEVNKAFLLPANTRRSHSNITADASPNPLKHPEEVRGFTCSGLLACVQHVMYVEGSEVNPGGPIFLFFSISP